MAARRVPGCPRGARAPFGRAPDNAGVIGPSALWRAGTRACRWRPAVRIERGHAPCMPARSSQGARPRSSFVEFRAASSMRRALCRTSSANLPPGDGLWACPAAPLDERQVRRGVASWASAVFRRALASRRESRRRRGRRWAPASRLSLRSAREGPIAGPLATRVLDREGARRQRRERLCWGALKSGGGALEERSGRAGRNDAPESPRKNDRQVGRPGGRRPLHHLRGSRPAGALCDDVARCLAREDEEAQRGEQRATTGTSAGWTRRGAFTAGSSRSSAAGLST